MIVDGLQINAWSRPVIEEVRSGGVDIVHATVGVWEDLAGAMTRIGSFNHLCRHNADIIRVVRTVDDMHYAKGDGVLGVVLGFQNSSMLGDDPEMAHIFADVGIRVVQLTYNIANHLGSSCWEPHDGGLTRAGHRMVAALNDAAVLIDISHVGDRTGREAVDASKQPIAITHGNPRSFCDSPRNKPDEVISAVAGRGGVIGCTLYPLFMGGADVTRGDYCRMLADLAERFGVEHVAIGTDAVLGWDADALGWMRSGRWDRPVDPTDIPRFPPWPAWFGGPEDFPSLAEGLDEAGFTEHDHDLVLGGNWLRLFGDVFTDDLRTIRVAPREIVDLVTRVLRIHGVDPAAAHATATDVMRCAAVGHGAVEAVLAAIDDGSVAVIGPPHRPVHAPEDSLAVAYRRGIEITEDRLDALERASAGFLVAEHTLDAIDDEPTVD